MAQDFISRFCRVVFLILCLNGGVLFAKDIYILSYKSQIKNNQLIYQSLYASKAMTPITDMHSVKAKTVFLTKECSKPKFFECYETEILNFLLQGDVLIHGHDSSEKLRATTFAELNISPQYLQVEFNDTFVKITLLKGNSK